MLAICWGAAAAPALADDVCDGFKWDVSKERALFASAAAAPATAGRDSKSAPAVVPNRLYQLKLAPQEQVVFAASAAKRTPTTAVYAGVVTFKVPAPGSYRISADGPLWIDVLSSGALVQPKDFQGLHGCNAPRKIVEFELNAAESLVLQLSNSDKDGVRLTITPSPVRKL